MIDDMKSLVRLFAPHCEQRETMDELARMLEDEEQWTGAHDLFRRIRRKSLDAVRDENGPLGAQYSFEEICAKTLFNLTDTDAPFDQESPYWIIPQALGLARALEIAESRVLEIVAPPGA